MKTAKSVTDIYAFRNPASIQLIRTGIALAVLFLLLLCRAQTIPAQNPKAAEKHHKQGLHYYEQEQYADALQAFNQALQLDSQFTQALNNKGNVFFRMGQPDKALYWYDEAIKTDSSFSTAFFNKGYLLIQKGENANALFNFNRAVSINPDNASTWSHIGWIKYRMMMYKEAEKEQTKALNIYSDYPLALYRRGKTRVKLMKFLQAENDFTKCIALSNYAPSYYERDHLKTLENQTQLAIKDLRNAIEQKPRYLKAYL